MKKLNKYKKMNKGRETEAKSSLESNGTEKVCAVWIKNKTQTHLKKKRWVSTIWCFPLCDATIPVHLEYTTTNKSNQATQTLKGKKPTHLYYDNHQSVQIDPNNRPQVWLMLARTGF